MATWLCVARPSRSVAESILGPVEPGPMALMQGLRDAFDPRRPF